jgi:hypothetical protein
MTSRRSAVAAVPLVVLFAAGCGGGDESIKTYRVARPDDAKPAGGATPAGTSPAARPAAEGGPYRILGAMFPADNPQWFFKLVGKADELAAVEKEFDTFLAGVKFPGGFGSPPAYDLPAGWTSAGKSGMRADTLKFGPGGKLEMSVIPSVGGVEGNLTRWAGQVGSDADKAKATREVTAAGGVKGLRVDLVGPKNPSGAMTGGPFSGGK